MLGWCGNPFDTFGSWYGHDVPSVLVEPLTQPSICRTYRFEAVSSSVWEATIDELDPGSVRQRIGRDGRVSDLIQPLGCISGELTTGTEAPIEVEATKGVEFEVLLVGGVDRTEPNLADLDETR